MSEEMKKELENENELENEAVAEEQEAAEESLQEAAEESLEDKINKIEEEVEEWKNAYLRQQAEFQNFTKRKERELDELRKYAAEKIVVKVLDAVDNLERAIAASSESKDFDSLVKGVEMTLGQMHGILNAEGVEAIESVGMEYDPHQHHAVMTESCEDMEDNHVLMELQKGYKMKGKIIRPAMVKVCKK